MEVVLAAAQKVVNLRFFIHAGVFLGEPVGMDLVWPVAKPEKHHVVWFGLLMRNADVTPSPEGTLILASTLPNITLNVDANQVWRPFVMSRMTAPSFVYYTALSYQLNKAKESCSALQGEIN